MAIKIKCTLPLDIILDGALELETVANAVELKRLTESIAGENDLNRISVAQAVKNVVGI